MDAILLNSPERLLEAADQFAAEAMEVQNLYKSMLDIVRDMSCDIPKYPTSCISKALSLEVDMDRLHDIIQEHLHYLHELCSVHMVAMYAPPIYSDMLPFSTLD